MAKQVAKLEQEDEFRGVPFSRKEAEAATQAFNRTTVEGRHRLLELFERRAHVALGYVSFEEYASDRLGIEMDGQRLYRMRLWARVERSALIPVDEQVDANIPMGILATVAKSPLTKHVAEELAKLPDAIRRDAYEEAVVLKSTGRPELQCVKNIVTRRLNELAGIVNEPPPVRGTAPENIGTSSAAASTSSAVDMPSRAADPPAPVVVETAQAPAPPPPVAAKPAPAVTRAPTREAEPEAVSREDIPLKQWVEALNSVLTWLENDHVDATPAYRKEASACLVHIAVWVERSR